VSEPSERSEPSEPASRRPLLDVAGLRVTYGGVVAVSDVDLQITEGTIFGLIGPGSAWPGRFSRSSSSTTSRSRRTCWWPAST
jgi:ABC-type phosphonate transport system ATPase subunit